MQAWLKENKLNSVFILASLGKNRPIESSHDKFWDEYLEREWFQFLFCIYSAYLNKNRHLWRKRPILRLLTRYSRPVCGDFLPKLAYVAISWASNSMAE